MGTVPRDLFRIGCEIIERNIFRADEKRAQEQRRRSSSSSTESDSSSEYSDTDSEDDRKSPEHQPPNQNNSAQEPARRDDDFFDQKVVGKDYTSVIDSLSQTSGVDSHNDFDSPYVHSKVPSSQGPTLKRVPSEEELDTRQIRPASSSSESETEEEQPRTSRPDPAKKDSDAFIDGFKVH